MLIPRIGRAGADEIADDIADDIDGCRKRTAASPRARPVVGDGHGGRFERCEIVGAARRGIHMDRWAVNPCRGAGCWASLRPDTLYSGIRTENM